ncbi:pyroglutamyl-peptidase 1 isoform X1 [Pundamilia nyererei]|uniref:Pyroglutamyl-peptidase 1 isoform X1 n=1 Tax=Pundamilia nyererei TaxID=303518 RepID=A0A9Y3R1K2_9CICH|nr:PREDICTED: pyroglutamyl-peptidase 1-like isoform X1 [Pundamilia nyererei]
MKSLNCRYRRRNLGSAMNKSETVVVTGFGPFRQFLTNTSWEAAKGLKLIGLGENVDVHVRELPVSYLKTQKVIGELWHTLNPKFAVHLGLARGSSVVILEQTGKNTGYRDRDVCGYCPETRCCVEGGAQKLESVINMRAVSKHFRQAGMNVVYSRDAGRYLCDFAYYCSLYHGQGRAALIHVPTSGTLASADRLVPLLQALIQKILEQLEEHSKTRDPPFVSMSLCMNSLASLHLGNLLEISIKSLQQRRPSTVA